LAFIPCVAIMSCGYWVMGRPTHARLQVYFIDLGCDKRHQRA
jgi:hypothetical protein